MFQYMNEIFCVEFQIEHLKFHTKHITHTMKDAILIHNWKFKSLQIEEPLRVFETPPQITMCPIPYLVWNTQEESLSLNET